MLNNIKYMTYYINKSNIKLTINIIIYNIK